MVIIGLTGDIGSGKTTFGGYLGELAKHHLHLESSELISEVANDLRLSVGEGEYPTANDTMAINTWLQSLPAIIAKRTRYQADQDQLQITPEKVASNPELFTKLFEYLQLVATRPDLRYGLITSMNKATHRPILQWLGGYLAKQADDTIWYRELIRRGQEHPELDVLTIGGVRFPADAACVHDAHGHVVELVRPSLERVDSQDITEKERKLIVPGIEIINDAGLAELQHCAEALLTDLRAGEPKTIYTASQLRAVSR